jgi:hypothetical protein
MISYIRSLQWHRRGRVSALQSHREPNKLKIGAGHAVKITSELDLRTQWQLADPGSSRYRAEFMRQTVY